MPINASSSILLHKYNLQSQKADRNTQQVKKVQVVNWSGFQKLSYAGLKVRF